MRFYILAIVFGIVLIAGCLQGQCPSDNKPVCGSNGVTYKNACFARQANVTSFNEGACPAAACSDSDGGKDIFTFGSVNEAGSESRDSCPSPSTVLERFCQGGSAQSESLPCPAGYACDGGACVSVPCTDTDGGLNENVKGSVSSAGKENPDECVGAAIVREYYCEGGKTAFKDISCGSGMSCSSGMCSRTLCTDTDGKDTAVKGTAKVGSQSSSDSCADASSVNEYFCDGDLMKLEKIACGSGFSCVDGKCQKSVCTDSDAGKNSQVKGTTSLGAVTYNDSCYSDTSVLEYFCATDTSIGNDPINCGTGNECFDGRCRPIQCTVNQTNIDDTDERHQIQSFDDADELTLFADNAVEINDGMYIRLQSVGVNSSTFRLYLNLQDLIDDDEECSETIDEGDVAEDLCGENTGEVEVISQDDGSDMAEVRLEEYYAVQIFSQDGVVRDWTDKPTCQDDEVLFDSYEADFYPYLDTDSGSLNLDGRTIEFLGTTAEIVEVTVDTLTIEVPGDELDLQDGETFEYLDQEYDVELVFGDGGLERMVIIES